MNDELNSEEERVLDVLLSEVHGSSGPRDFAHEIISHLNATASQSGPWIAPTVRVTRSRSRKSSLWLLAPVVIGIAASVLIAVMYGRSIQPQPNLSQPIAANSNEVRKQPDSIPTTDSKQVVELASKGSASKTSVDAAPAQAKQDDFPQHGFEPSKATELLSGTPGAGTLATDARTDKFGTPLSNSGTKTRSTGPAPKSLPVRLVSQHVEEELRAYWRNSQIEPTEDASPQDVSKRIANLLGVDIAVDNVRDVERLQTHLAQPEAADSIATRWLNELTMNGFRRMSEEDQQSLKSSFSKAIVNRNGFDQVIVDLITGKNPASSSWYGALASSGEAAMHHRLAAVSMNVDLRCTRCHDALDDSKGEQQAHWSFVAVLKSRIRLNEMKDRWEILEGDTGRRNQFYDLLDGRRRIARASISPEWMGADSVDPVSTLDQWADELVGSRPLANGIVNSLWRTLYGRSLVASSFDAIDLPSQKPLQRLQKELSDDLIASDFDVSRTLALMIQAPSFQRSVPSALQPQRSSLVRRTELEQANQLVGVFAAAAPPPSQLGMDKKMVYVLRSTGSKIALPGDVASSVLGQAEVMNSKQTRNALRMQAALSKELPVDFPTVASESPVPWLDRMSDIDDKVSHLAYLSGRSGVPDLVDNAVKAMREVKIDEALILRRVEWLLAK